MPVYRYKGVAAGNRAVAATIDADSLRAARAKLRAEGIFPTEIVIGKTRGETSELLAKLQLPGDHQVFLDYQSQSKTPGAFAEWKRRWVDQVHCRQDYLNLLGQDRLANLALKYHDWSEPVDYGY